MNISVDTVRLFTPAQANATLPLVKMIVGDIVPLSRSIVQTRDRLDALQRRTGKQTKSNYSEELEDIESKLAEDIQKLESFVEELRELGVEPKVLTEGLLDFPAMIEGRIVNLCWKHGEEQVEFWHPLDAGFSGRQPVDGFDFQNPETN